MNGILDRVARERHCERRGVVGGPKTCSRSWRRRGPGSSRPTIRMRSKSGRAVRAGARGRGELTREARRRMRPVDELRRAVEAYLDDLELADELARSGNRSAMRSTAAASACGRCCASRWPRRQAPTSTTRSRPSRSSLVHMFSLAHDDLPALDDDDERRRSAQRARGVRRGRRHPRGRRPSPRRRGWRSTRTAPSLGSLTGAVLGMIGGQARDIAGENGDLAALHRLKTGGCLPPAPAARSPWRACPNPTRRRGAPSATSLGLLFQIVDDILDGDGASSSSTAPAKRAGWPTRRPSARSRGCARSRRIPRCRGDRRRARRPDRLGFEPRASNHQEFVAPRPVGLALVPRMTPTGRKPTFS